MSIGLNIGALLASKQIKQSTFAAAIGCTQGAISQWISGNRRPSEAMIRAICDTYNVTRDDIVSDSIGLYAKLHGLTSAPVGAIAPKASEPAYLPLRGRVHAGEPTDPECLDGMVELPASVAEGHPNAYFLEVEGDCMDRIYPQGCLILVDPDKMPADGSIAAVSIDGQECVMRRLKRGATSLMLIPESYNTSHVDIVVSQGDGHTVELVGTVVWFQPIEELE